mgnify:CR=1 FL=1
MPVPLCCWHGSDSSIDWHRRLIKQVAGRYRMDEFSKAMRISWAVIKLFKPCTLPVAAGWAMMHSVHWTVTAHSGQSYVRGTAWSRYELAICHLTI